MDIRKDKVLAAMVRSFFEAFSSGVIDSSTHDPKDKLTSQTVRRLMLDHYEHIVPAFMETMFYPLALMNFGYDEIERVVREADGRGDDMMSLVRTACGTAAMYEAMVAEYKRNFSNLLAGKYASAADHLESFVSVAGEGMANGATIGSDVAIRLLVRVVMRSYVSGLVQASEEGASRFRQPTLFRLMLDAMNVLLLDEAVDYADCGDDLSAMFLKVCLNEHNFTLMTREMDSMHEELSNP